MSNCITVDVQPGYYTENQTINISFAPNVVEVAINKDGRPPSISKYIAWDTLANPQPFIAVTEDGRGRVLFDGSFPKMYNSVFESPGTSGSRKYLFNALEWLIDPLRERKILFLGDANSGASYNIKNTRASDFNTTINTIIREGNYQGSIIKTSSDYAGGNLDPRYSELSQYAAVLLMGSANIPLTSAAVNDLVRYRESGGGILLITDSSPHLPTIEAAIDHGNNGGGGHFSRVVNQVAVRFGAWFTDLVNRPSVQVGHIRQNYGDHFLYNGIADAEYLMGGSDSTIRVTSDTLTPVASAQKQFTTKVGLNTINAMAVLDNGEMVPVKFEYNIIDSTTLFVIDGDGYGHGQTIDVGSDNFIDVEFTQMGEDISMAADIFLDSVKIGNLSKVIGQEPIWSMLNGGGKRIHINNNTTLTLKYTNPVGFEATVYIKRDMTLLSTVESMNYPQYDEFLLSVRPTARSAPFRLEQAAGARMGVYSLPYIVKYSKDNLTKIYGDMEPTFTMTVGEFFVNVTHFGYNLPIGGSLSPLDDKNNIPIRDILSHVGIELDIRIAYVSLSEVPIAIYMDGTGPFYLKGTSSSGGTTWYFYTNGVLNVYEYLRNRLGKKVEFRFIYSE